MRALARGGHRRATPAREQGEGLVTKTTSRSRCPSVRSMGTWTSSRRSTTTAPFLTEILAEPLVGRLKREIDRKTFTVLPLGHVSATTRRAQSRRWRSASSSPRTWLSSSVRTRFPSASGRSSTTTSPCTSAKSSGKGAGPSSGTSSTPTATSSTASRRAKPTSGSLRKQPRPWDGRTLHP